MPNEITIRVSIADAARITRAFNEGKLKAAGVTGVRLEPMVPSISAPVGFQMPDGDSSNALAKRLGIDWPPHAQYLEHRPKGSLTPDRNFCLLPGSVIGFAEFNKK